MVHLPTKLLFAALGSLSVHNYLIITVYGTQGDMVLTIKDSCDIQEKVYCGVC